MVQRRKKQLEIIAMNRYEEPNFFVVMLRAENIYFGVVRLSHSTEAAYCFLLLPLVNPECGGAPDVMFD